MALVQIGYLGKQGPTFYDDSAPGGKKYLLQGAVQNGKMILQIVQPAFATALNAGLTASDYVLGSYSDLQYYGDAPTYYQPSTGAGFSGYQAKTSDWVPATSTTGNTPISGTTTTGGNTTSTGGGSTTTTTTTTGGGTVTTGNDTTFSAPTIMEQIQTFLSNYWWLVLLVVAALLWKPVLAPALGLGKRRRR